MEVGGEVVVLVNVDEKRALVGGDRSGVAVESGALVGCGGNGYGLSLGVGVFLGINGYGAAFRRVDVDSVAGIDELYAQLHIPGRGDDQGVVEVLYAVVGEGREGIVLVGNGGEGYDVAGFVVFLDGGNGDASVFAWGDVKGVGAGQSGKGS